VLLGSLLVTLSEVQVVRPLLAATPLVSLGHPGQLSSSPPFFSASACVVTRAPAAVTAVAHGAADAASAAPMVMRDAVLRTTTPKLSLDNCHLGTCLSDRFWRWQGVNRELEKVQRQFCRTQLSSGRPTATPHLRRLKCFRQLDFVCSYLI
jgi:hypothetical protein